MSGHCETCGNTDCLCPVDVLDVAALTADRDEWKRRAEAAEQQAAQLRAALQAVMRRIDRSGNACWCPPIFDDRVFHTSDCLRARAALGASHPAPAAEEWCTEDRHILLPSGEACVCGENVTEQLL